MVAKAAASDAGVLIESRKADEQEADEPESIDVAGAGAVGVLWHIDGIDRVGPDLECDARGAENERWMELGLDALVQDVNDGQDEQDIPEWIGCGEIHLPGIAGRCKKVFDAKI